MFLNDLDFLDWRDLQANRSPNGWSAMSEDLLPGVSVIDLRVVDYSTLRLETGLDIEIFKLGLLVKWAQMKYLGSAWLVEMTKTQRQNTYDTNYELYYNCLLLEI